MLTDGLAPYRGLVGASLPFVDPEPVLLPAAGVTLAFYGFDDPAMPRIGVEKDFATNSVRVVELP